MQNNLKQIKIKSLSHLPYPQALKDASAPANIIYKDSNKQKRDSLNGLASKVNTSLQSQLKSASINNTKRFELKLNLI